MQNEEKTDPATTEILLAMTRRKLCQDAIDNDHMEPPFAILTTDNYGSIASEHSIAVDAEGGFMETEVRGSEAGRMCGHLICCSPMRGKESGKRTELHLAATLDLQY
jgi:hypothetical protein